MILYGTMRGRAMIVYVIMGRIIILYGTLRGRASKVNGIMGGEP